MVEFRPFPSDSQQWDPGDRLRGGICTLKRRGSNNAWPHRRL
jgi:hypothetical protein